MILELSNLVAVVGIAVVVDGGVAVVAAVDVIVVIVSDFVRQQQSLCLLFMVN